LRHIKAMTVPKSYRHGQEGVPFPRETLQEGELPMLRILVPGAVAAFLAFAGAAMAPMGAAAAPNASLLGEMKSAARTDTVEVQDRKRSKTGRARSSQRDRTYQRKRTSRSARSYGPDSRYRVPRSDRRRYARRPYYDPYYYDPDYYYPYYWYEPDCIYLGPFVICP
jgi:hypothetical protein